VDIDSKVGDGTTIRIKLPLTLAIIPSQIISVGSERYAIPQVNLNELLRIPASQVKERIEKVGDAEVVRLRGNLLPLLDLAEVLQINKTYVDGADGRVYPDRRTRLSDRRASESPLLDGDEDEARRLPPVEEEGDEDVLPTRGPERRQSAESAVNIAVVTAGSFRYGLVVDQLWDSEEIVVKPLGRHLTGCEGYAGATIMGDGKVALILDVAGLARMANLTSLKGAERVSDAAREVAQEENAVKDMASFLLFRNSENEQCAVPLGVVERIERIGVDRIEILGGKRVVQYRGGSLPLFSLDDVADVRPLPESKQLEVIIFKLSGKEVGLLVTPPVDAMDVSVDVDMITLKQPGVMGSAVIGGRTTMMIDIFEIVRSVNPGWFDEKKSAPEVRESRPTILFAEDSDFFRSQVKGFLEDENYNVMEASDGRDAWELLVQHPGEIDLIVTDLEMPNMNGFELASMIKEDERFSSLPIIALTSLAGDEDIARGTQMGINDYHIKLDRDKLIESTKNYLNK
jgi:two-component system chemotaxis sensor kinase CheA